MGNGLGGPQKKTFINMGSWVVGLKQQLGGGFKHFLFSPRSLGKWSNFDLRIFFKWVGSTTKLVEDGTYLEPWRSWKTLWWRNSLKEGGWVWGCLGYAKEGPCWGSLRTNHRCCVHPHRKKNKKDEICFGIPPENVYIHVMGTEKIEMLEDRNMCFVMMMLEDHRNMID